jgi:rare lipoprotein A
MKVIRGDASYYGAEHGFHGSCMANGEIYDKEAPTAAHRSLPLGTVVRVWYQSRSVIVEITDRGPYAEDEGGGLIESRVIDLSEGSARTLGLIRQGVGLVTIEILKQPEESQMYHHEHPECLRGSLARRSYLLSRTQ